MKNVPRVSKAAALRTIKSGYRDRLIPDDIHIIMPEAAAKKWLQDLRSGTFIQDNGYLHCPETGGFCCLGVQQYGALKGNIEVRETSDTNVRKTASEFLDFPSSDYLRAQGIAFLTEGGCTDNNPWIPSEQEYVADLNDDVTYNGKHVNDFSKMADFIESTLAVY